MVKKLNEEQMSRDKRLALQTLNKVKEIYDSSESSLLTGGFWHDFMAEVDEQIREIERTCK